MNKKKELLSGGLKSLIGGADKQQSIVSSVVSNTASAEEVIEEATPEEEDELLTSIEDDQLRAALEAKRNQKRGRPRKGVTVGSKQDEVYTRFCTLIRRDQLAKIKEICYLETLTLKELLGAIYEEAINNYEETHGEITFKRTKTDASTLFKKNKR